MEGFSDDLLQVRNGIVAFHVLRDGDSLYLIGAGLLFSGDLFASFPGAAHLPPPFLNDDPARAKAAPALALALGPGLRGVLPSHCDSALPAVHLRRLRKLAKRLPVAKGCAS